MIAYFKIETIILIHQSKIKRYILLSKIIRKKLFESWLWICYQIISYYWAPFQILFWNFKC